MKPAGKIRLAAIVVCLAALEIACQAGWIARLTLIPPSEMASGLVAILWGRAIEGEIAATMGGIALAAAGSIVVGFLLGVLLHAWPRIRTSLDPLLATYYSIPIFVFYPMLIVFFGMNRAPIIIIGFLFAVVAMMTNVMNGLDRVPRVLIKSARVLRMRRVAITFRIVLPSAAPYIFTGAKLAVAYAFVGVLGAEFILANAGIGYQIAFAFNDFDNVKMYALILLVVLVISAVNGLLFAWERALLRRRGQW